MRHSSPDPPGTPGNPGLAAGADSSRTAADSARGGTKRREREAGSLAVRPAGATPGATDGMAGGGRAHWGTKAKRSGGARPALPAPRPRTSRRGPRAPGEGRTVSDAIEALAYDLLETYRAEVDFSAMRKWQPSKEQSRSPAVAPSRGPLRARPGNAAEPVNRPGRCRTARWRMRVPARSAAGALHPGLGASRACSRVAFRSRAIS